MSATKKESTPEAAPPVSRREFMYYLWGASMALFMAQGAGLTVWFIFPRFREGEFGGTFTIPIENLPEVDAPPQDNPEGRFWLVNIGGKLAGDERIPEEYPQTAGVKAIYKICVHLGCLYKWVPVNDRFECPCHGSKYLASGVRVAGPATRNLDMFIVEAIDENGNVLATTEPITHSTSGLEEGGALELPEGTVAIRVDTGNRIDGALNTRLGGGV